MPKTRTWIAGLAVVAPVLMAWPVAGAERAERAPDAGMVDSEAPVRYAADDPAVGADAGSSAEDTAVLALDRQARAVRALAAGQLDPALDPASLFEVPLADEDAVDVDAARLRALLHEIDGSARRAGKGDPRVRARVVDAGVAEAGVDRALWNARIDLDRSRLAFYELPASRREELLAARALRETAAATRPSAAQLRERDAEGQRQTALRAAETARTEAERVVATELARLLDVEHAQASVAEQFGGQRREIAEQRELTIGWQERALEAHGDSGPSADRTYEDLRSALRTARDALSQALDQLGGAPSAVPRPGPDALSELRVDVNTSAAREERNRVEAGAARLEIDEQALRHERAAQLFDEINVLNGERLALLAALSPAMRATVTGFTRPGLDQAASEARQLSLILRYHRYIIVEWLLALRHPDRALGGKLAGGAGGALEGLLALGAFLWWRRRSTALLAVLHRRAVDGDRSERLANPSPASRALAFVAQVHRPIEWLALLSVLRGLLPISAQRILEVRLLSTLTIWVFGAALIINVVNALAGTGSRSGPRRDEPDSAALRLRSLRLVGRVVVAFGLILVVSSMLVGQGTIYQWVFSTCWLASVPVLLVLVRWWRNIVFRRTARVRKPARIQRWVLATSQGWWTSFAAAAVGGLYLFASGAARGARNWIGRFVITRRALVFLFQRQLDKRAHTGEAGPIPSAAFDALGPERPSAKWISGDSDKALSQLAQRIRARKGGVIAIVGERGMGKTAALRRLRGEGNDTVLLDLPSSDPDAVRRRFAESLALQPMASFEESAAALAASSTIHALLLDDAHRFVQPVVGGLATFDALLAAVGRHATATTWVFAFDRIIWQFLNRSRGARPLFDDILFLEPWAEERIVNLLQARTEDAALSPSFDGLLEPLPATADEVDRQDALAQTAGAYYRLLWDAATGNPGVALHLWRRSLGTDTDGKTAVRPSTTLDTTDLERLPDASVFVLRAVLQLAPARAEQIAKGSSIRLADVAEALRYADSRGYIEEREGGYRVTWTWFRTITLFLQRKHLLATR